MHVHSRYRTLYKFKDFEPHVIKNDLGKVISVYNYLRKYFLFTLFLYSFASLKSQVARNTQNSHTYHFYAHAYSSKFLNHFHFHFHFISFGSLSFQHRISLKNMAITPHKCINIKHITYPWRYMHVITRKIAKCTKSFAEICRGAY